MEKWDPNWTTEKVGSYASDDNYWAGAKKACDDIGMSLPDKSKLESIYKAGQKDSSLGLPTSGWFMSSSESRAHMAYVVHIVHFGDGNLNYGDKRSSDMKVLCVGD